MFLPDHIIYFYIKGFGFPRWGVEPRDSGPFVDILTWLIGLTVPQAVEFSSSLLNMYVLLCLIAQCVWLFAIPWSVAHKAPLAVGCSPGQNTGVGCQALLQGIFLTQGSNPGLLHCRQILYCLSHQGSPNWGKESGLVWGSLMMGSNRESLWPSNLSIVSKCLFWYIYLLFYLSHFLTT